MKEKFIKTNKVIAKALNVMGISPEAFAYSINKDRSTVYRYISSDSNVPLEVLTNVLDLLYDHGVDIVKVLDIEDENDFYYHATTREIEFPINAHINDGDSRDFGYGFYLGESLRQSCMWGRLGSPTIIYRFKKSKFAKLSMLSFDKLKPIDWLNYVAINRRKIKYNDFPKLFRKYTKIIENFDVIEGKIADSFSYEVLELLYVDKLDIDQAEYSTKIMALGNQLCIKNDEFAKTLEPDEIIKFDLTLSKYFAHYSNMIQDKQNKHIELIIKNPPKKERLFSTYLKNNE